MARTKKPSAVYWWIGILLSALGAICFSTKAILVKLAYQEAPIDPIALLALRMLFSLPFFIGAAVFTSKRESNVRFSNQQWVTVALIGFLGFYISSYLDFWGLQFISAGIERLILFIYPTFVVIFSALFFKIAVGRRQIAALLITYVGLCIAYLAEVQVKHTGGNFFLGSLLVFGCAVTYALYIALSGKLIPAIGSVKFNSYAMTFASLGVLIHFMLTSNSNLLGWPPIIYIYAVCMAVFSTVIPSYLVSISLNRLGANNTAIIASIGPVSTILQASYFLNETVTAWQWLGTVLILCGIIMISWRATSLSRDP